MKDDDAVMSNIEKTQVINSLCRLLCSRLMLIYSMGHGILAIIFGTSFGLIQMLSKSEKYGSFSTILKIFMGLLILLIGFYMFYLGF